MGRVAMLLCTAGTLVLTACSPRPAGPAEDPPGASSAEEVAAIPRDELRRATEAEEVLRGARALMEGDQNVALVTVDAGGRPRIRSVRAFLDPVDPSRRDRGFTVWVMTRFATRKVDQIRANPKVTLYFNDDAKGSYVSIMGTAVVHTDPTNPGAKRHYDDEDVKFFWPDFPRDFVMLQIQPEWLEYIGPGVSNDETTWRPQAVVFR